ncbi:SGNH/GDSL hydrolase family protein [Cohnella lubricantis]|uniref:SGNH/GDSL hydrolase family protein n=2 Tax=Cohnella lubricantis TaxID=2163172 RepID=A0A841TDF2_9BACL|nr:SGNH/GDSL hydrolase family protein [Cohnella lubricantis]
MEKPFSINGFPWFDEDKRYRRLPAAPAVPLPLSVDKLADCTAGGQIRFRTNSSRLTIRVKLAGRADMDHMPATGQCGFDCYLGAPGEQRYVSTARVDLTAEEYEATLYDWKRKQDQLITLHFPLYQGVKEVWIGVDADAVIDAAPALASDKPVVLYGTSITQGGCATRPGMAYPNILSRRIPLPFVNLGFSGSGKGEPEVARTIADIANPALFVLDYEANAGTPSDMAATLPPFIRILRERHPDTPILVLSKIRFAGELFYEEQRQLSEERRKIQSDTVTRLREEGDLNVRFFDGSTLLGDEDAEECTVDGVHPTDLGFLRMARTLEPVIRELVNRELV